MEYKIRARAYQQGDTSFWAKAGVIAEKTGRPLTGIQTSFPQGGWEALQTYGATAQNRFYGGRQAQAPQERPVRYRPIRWIFPLRRGLTPYTAEFKTLVRKTGPGNFGQNEEKIWDSWQVRVPATTGDHTKWREAEGECYITVEPLAGYEFQPATYTQCNTSSNGQTGMDVIFDYLKFTPVTEADHI